MTILCNSIASNLSYSNRTLSSRLSFTSLSRLLIPLLIPLFLLIPLPIPLVLLIPLPIPLVLLIPLPIPLVLLILSQTSLSSSLRLLSHPLSDFSLILLLPTQSSHASPCPLAYPFSSSHTMLNPLLHLSYSTHSSHPHPHLSSHPVISLWALCSSCH